MPNANAEHDRRPRAVLLDAAGTLIRPARPVGTIYAEVAHAHGARVAPDALAAGFRVVFPRMPPMAFGPVAPRELDRLERDWWRSLVRDVLAHCAVRIDPFDAFFETLYARFAEPAAWRTFDEVDATLARLRRAGLRLAIVSNFDSRLEQIAGGLGLAARVDAIVYSTRAGYAKPHPGIFAEALERLGVEAGQAVHVGDSLEADYGGASAAGIRAWHLDRGAPRRADVPTVSDLDAFASRVLDER